MWPVGGGVRFVVRGLGGRLASKICEFGDSVVFVSSSAKPWCGDSPAAVTSQGCGQTGRNNCGERVLHTVKCI